MDALHVCDPYRLAVANNTGPLSRCPLIEQDYLLKQFEFCLNNYCAKKEDVCANIREVSNACWVVEDRAFLRAFKATSSANIARGNRRNSLLRHFRVRNLS